MATTNDITITRALYGITKTTAKISFAFFIIAAILISVTINAGDPNINTYTLYDEKENFLYGFQVSEGSSDIQIGYITISNENLVDYIEFKIQKISSDGAQILDDVLTSRSSEFFRELSLEPGKYRVMATAYFNGVTKSNETVEIASGYGSFNLVLVGLSILSIVIASISMGILFTVLPFTIFVLIFNSFNNTSKSKYVQSKTQNQKSEVTKSTQSTPLIQTVTTRPKAKPVTFDPESFLAKLTTKDWTWLTIALISFLGFIFQPDSPLLFFAIIITGAVFYSVSEREKTKMRILNLLNNYHETSVDFLGLQLAKKRKYVIKVLQFMILDDAMPIMLDMNTLNVIVTGSLTPYLSSREFESSSVSHKDTTNFKDQPKTEIVSSEDATIVQIAIPEESEGEMHCTACGESLIGKPKYCYICGQKTI